MQGERERSFVGQLLFVENLFSRSELFLERSRALLWSAVREELWEISFFPPFLLFSFSFLFFFRWHRRSTIDRWWIRGRKKLVANETGSILFPVYLLLVEEKIFVSRGCAKDSLDIVFFFFFFFFFGTNSTARIAQAYNWSRSVERSIECS